jgi:sugar phosphate isomerase/epimerase
MEKTLGPEALGIRGLSLPDAIALARETGFAGLAFDVAAAADLADAHGVAYVAEMFAGAGVRPACWFVPIAWQQGDDWAGELPELSRLAAVARELDCPRAATFMPSGSNERPYEANFAWHVARLRRIAEVLRDEGCRFGIEYVGPKTFRAEFRYEFIYTLDGLLELIRAVGTGNVGVLLDSWHLYTAGESLADLDRLTADDVVAVHVNDAPAGVPRDEQMDRVRTLPMETGVIDLVGFMRKLRDRGYDGPVMPEPFSRRVEDLAATDPTSAGREAARAMDALWRAAGLD